MNPAEIEALRPAESSDSDEVQEEIERRREDWVEHKTPAFASDFVGVAVTLGRPEEARDAASYLAERAHISPGLQALVLKALGDEQGELVSGDRETMSIEERRSRISRLKGRLIRGPRNPLLWSDLALDYSALGQNTQAAYALEVARSLAPDNRFLLRASARFLVHTGDEDIALSLLRRSPLSRHDPWVLAAEISVSDIVGKPSRNVKLARAMLDSGRFRAGHISELAGALGTMELKSGARKKALRLLGLSLKEPTENTLAQIAWLAQESDAVGVFGVLPDLPHNFEAKSIEHYHSHDWEQAVSFMRVWLSDEPFSGRPAMMGSYVASMALEDHTTAIDLASRALTANSADFGLANNLAFAYASLDQTQKAKDVLGRFEHNRLTAHEQMYYDATCGLVNYREDDIEEARARYAKVIERAEGDGKRAEVAMARLIMLREETRIAPTHVHALKQSVMEAWDGITDPDMAAYRVLFRKLVLS